MNIYFFSSKPSAGTALAALRLFVFALSIVMITSCRSKKEVVESQEETTAANIKGMSEAISAQLAQYRSASFDSLSLTISFPWHQSSDTPATAETAHAYSLQDSLSMLLGSGDDLALLNSDSAFLQNRYTHPPDKGGVNRNNVQQGTINLKIYGSRTEESTHFDLNDDKNFFDSTNIVQNHWEKKKTTRPSCNPGFYFLILLNILLFILLWYLYKTFWKDKNK